MACCCIPAFARGAERVAYDPIENYGIVGDLRTVSLISMSGSVDWLCFPRFDSPSIFGALLDDRKGRFFWITPDSGNVKRKQFYWPQSNVLVTGFFCEEGVADVTDYIPVGGISRTAGRWTGARTIRRNLFVASPCIAAGSVSLSAVTHHSTMPEPPIACS